jgi:hypothetical protein
MSVEGEVLSFTDNWSYLKAELAWLDRVLMRAVARHREVEREVARVAKNNTDRATSHWWRGFIVLDSAKGGSQVRWDAGEFSVNHPLGRFGDRLEQSQRLGINLAIPSLCAHLGLGKFERDLLILCLAPEISRRYEKLYALLNNDEANCRQPTVDLALRLFCRSDSEWRLARQCFSREAPLIKYKLLLLLPSPTSARTLISQVLCLPEKVASFCLGDPIPLSSLLPQRRSRTRQV